MLIKLAPSALAGLELSLDPRRERKGFLVAFGGRTSSYRTRRFYTINSKTHFRSHKHSKHQLRALLNGSAIGRRLRRFRPGSEKFGTSHLPAAFSKFMTPIPKFDIKF